MRRVVETGEAEPNVLTCDDVVAANAVSVMGEAFVATLTVDLADGKTLEAIRDQLVKKMLRDDTPLGEKVQKAAEKAFGGIGRGYEVDSLRWRRDRVDIYVFGTTTANRSLLAGVFSTPQDSWTQRVDAALEDMRRKFRDTLREAEVDADVRATWAPGAGLKIVEGAFDPSAGDRRIREYLRDLRSREQKLSRTKMLFGAITGALGLASVAGFLSSPAVGLAALFYSSLFFGGAVATRQAERRLREERREINETLDLRELLDEDEKRAQRLFQLHSLELKRYYDQALRQRSYIFWMGLMCIGGGFAAVGVAFWILKTSGGGDVTQKIVVGAIGAIGAILANYVAAIYLRMFAETVRSISGFHNRLVVTHHVHFGNYLAAKIKDETMRYATLHQMAVALSGHREDDPHADAPAPQPPSAPERKGVLARLGL